MSIRALVVDYSQTAGQIIGYYLRATACTIASEVANTADALRLLRKTKTRVRHVWTW